MKKLHILLTLTSLNVLLVTVERFSPTAKIFLQPYNFLRFHEVLQMLVLILTTVLIPFYIFAEVSGNFKLLESRKGKIMALLFVTGIYFYATGNGVHELASFFYNSYCSPASFLTICKGMFFNDYYFGNALYFVGAFLLVVPVLVLESMNAKMKMTKKDKVLIIVNALIFSLAIFAYSGFDIVLVGLIYSLITLAFTVWFVLRNKSKLGSMPYTFYTLVSYGVGTVASVLVRMIR